MKSTIKKVTFSGLILVGLFGFNTTNPITRIDLITSKILYLYLGINIIGTGSIFCFDPLIDRAFSKAKTLKEEEAIKLLKHKSLEVGIIFLGLFNFTANIVLGPLYLIQLIINS